MDHSIEDSLKLENMDFDHSEDVVNQEEIPLEHSGRLDCLTMDMDDVGEQSHPLMEAVNDEVIVSDLIEDPFPFQEFTMRSNNASSHNIMVDPHKLNQMSVQQEPEASMQYTEPIKAAAPAKPNVVTVKVAQQRTAKRMVASTPLRQVAIAPKPAQPKPVQYAIAPKPVALIGKNQTVGAFNKIPINSSANVKGNTVLAQIGRQLVMVPKKIKLMSSTAAEGVINPSSTGLQYQVACASEQAQQIANVKGAKPMLKFVQIQGQSSADKSPAVFNNVVQNVPGRARYVMQQKTVPIGNKLVQGPLQNLKLVGKKKIIAIKSQNPTEETTQGNVATKKVFLSNPNQKVLIRTNAPTHTTQVVKDSGSTGQRTQFHPINVPGKGIQYIKVVTPSQKLSQKPVPVPSKNFVFTDSKGNIIQMTAEKVLIGPQSAAGSGTTAAGSKVMKTLKSQRKLVRIAPVTKAVTPSSSISQPGRSSQSLLVPIKSEPTSSTAPMTSLPSISSPETSACAENVVSIEEFNDMVEQNKETSDQQSFSSNYVDYSGYTDANDFSTDNDFCTANEEYSTTNEYSTAEDSRLNDDSVEESIDPNETIDEKPTLQSLISDAVSEERESDHQMDTIHHEVEIGFENKRDTSISSENASFMLRDDSNAENDLSNTNEESIIIVPGSNYTERITDSVYSNDSQPYRDRGYCEEDRKNVPILNVEAECFPYSENIMLDSPPPPDPDTQTNIDSRSRKPCNCTKSQCLKLYCDCFANGEFCNNCNCKKCHNNLENEEVRQKAIRSCLERNPNAFRPKIGKSKTGGPEIIRRHTKGCNCKRSGCLKNYCECYEAKIACTAMCKCVGCRNVEETLIRRRDALRLREKLDTRPFRPTPALTPTTAKQPCSFMTTEVIEAVCQCLVAAAGERDACDPVHDVIDEFARCLQDVITASHHSL